MTFNFRLLVKQHKSCTECTQLDIKVGHVNLCSIVAGWFPGKNNMLSLTVVLVLDFHFQLLSQRAIRDDELLAWSSGVMSY